jgi:putative drug exporter of the RND superfamily
MLERLGRFCARHNKPVIGLWLLAVILAVVLSAVAGGDESNSFELPGTEAQEASDALDEDFPAQAGSRAQVVFRARGDGTIADQEDQINKALKAAEKLPHIVTSTDPDTGATTYPGVTSPFVPDASCTNSDQNPFCTVSPDGKVAYSNIAYTKTTSEIGLDGADELVDALTEFRTDDLEIQFGGDLLVNTEPIDTGASEEIGLIAAIIVLLITLGAVAAMGIPIISALVGVGTGLAVIKLVANVLTVPAVAPAAAIMIGLGVGIDYSLFVVGRFKAGLAEGLSVEEAAGKTVATSGRAVVTAGSTVIVALFGLFVFQVPAVSVIALAIAIVVVISIIGAVTLLPALCGLLGHHIDWGRLRFSHPEGREGHTPMGMRWVRFVTKVPIASALIALIVLILIAIPSLSMRLGPATSADSPTSSTEYKSNQIVNNYFGPGFTNPFLGVIEVGGNKTSSDSGVVDDVGKLLSDIAATPDVAQVNPSPESLTNSTTSDAIAERIFNDDGTVAIVSVIPDSSPKSERTPELVDDLRDTVIPKATAENDLDMLIGGTSAGNVDLDDRITSRLAMFIGLVILISFVILGMTFRSIPIPIKAAIFNLLAIFAAYGVLVMVFQWGWGADLIGVDQTTPIISYLAPIIFAVLFGLSMDYEVYIVSRIHEEYGDDFDAKRAVHDGHGSSARMVVAAATIMFCVFVAFVLSPSIIMKQFGLGLAVAILIDAFIIRMILLPAVLRLLGHVAWWPGNRHVAPARTPSPSPAPSPSPTPSPEPAG